MPIVQPPQFQGPQQFQPQYEPTGAERAFGGLSAGLGTVLAAMQQQKENEYRRQQLATNQQFAQAQLQQIAAQIAEAERVRTGQRQVGTAMQTALGMGQQPQPMQPQRGNMTAGMSAPMAQPQQQPGNFTQQQEPGVFTQILGGGSAALAPAQGNPDIFGGVLPENMSAAVEGVSAVKKLAAPAASDLPNSAQEFLFAQKLATLSPELAQEYKTMIGPKPGTTVNVDTKGETQYAKDLATEDVKRLTQAKLEARNAYKALPRITEAYKLTKTIYTGAGSNVELALGRVISKMGGKTAGDKVADTQTFLRLAGEGMVQYLNDRTFGAGTGISNEDREWALRLWGGDLALDAQGIRRILRINGQIGIEKVQSAITEMQEQAANHPQVGNRNKVEVDKLTKQLKAMQAQFDQMVKAEAETPAVGASADDLFPVRK